MNSQVISKPNADSTFGEVVLTLNDARVGLVQHSGFAPLLDGVSLKLRKGETIGLVGESGSGKSLTARTLIGLLPRDVVFQGNNPVQWSKSPESTDRARESATVRPGNIGVVFQDPLSGLNPVVKIGSQMSWVVRAAFDGMSDDSVSDLVRRYIQLVGLEDAERVYASYPHQLSGGMRQRVLIAMALIRKPSVLIADEPTTALDVTSQRTILELINSLKEKLALSVLFITHDLAVVSELCDRVAVMYAGRIVEEGPLPRVFKEPRHPYTRALIDSSLTLEDRGKGLRSISGSPIAAYSVHGGCAFVDRCTYSRDIGVCSGVEPPFALVNGNRVRCHYPLADQASSGLVYPTEDSRHAVPVKGDDRGAEASVFIELDRVSKVFRKGRLGDVHAVKDVSFRLQSGTTMGVVGESGSGKSTVARLALGLLAPTEGEVRFKGQNVGSFSKSELQTFRSEVQFVYQNPYSSLNPRMSVQDALCEPLIVRGVTRDAAMRRANEVIDSVGLTSDVLQRHPSEFSGGQRQRIVIARAMVVNPEVLILDEAVSALDVSVQAQVLNLLKNLQRDFGLTYLFISHDLGVIGYLCTDVIVMNKGQIVESGPVDDILTAPQHEYTRSLLDSMPHLDR